MLGLRLSFILIVGGYYWCIDYGVVVYGVLVLG